MKSLRSTLLLLVVALLGGAYLFFAERNPAPRPGALVLLRSAPDEVQTIKFWPSGLKLRREGAASHLFLNPEAWRIVDEKSGLDAPADPDLVHNLLDHLQLVQSDAPVTNPEKLSIYGLEKPRARLEVNGKVLEFGVSPSFDAHRVYTRSTAGIALLDDTLPQAARRSLRAWRDRAIWRFQPGKIAQIILRTPQTRADFSKNGAEWKLQKPLGARADAQVIADFLEALQAARTTQWLDERGANPQKWGLGTPRATLWLGQSASPGTKPGFKLEIGAPQKGGVAARASTSRAIFLLPAATYALMNRPLVAWRDRKVVVFEASSVAEIEVAARGARRKLVKSDNNWAFDGDLTGERNNSQARRAALDLLDFLGALPAENFVDNGKIEAKSGFDRPVLVLKIASISGATTKVQFAQAGGRLYARTLGNAPDRKAQGATFVLETDALNPIHNALDKILPKSPLRKPQK